jgi:hypothetical protein
LDRPAKLAPPPHWRLQVDLFYHMALKRRTAAESDPAKPHKFWDTQPVSSLAETPSGSGEAIEAKTVADVRATPYKLPGGFAWCSVDIENEAQVSSGGLCGPRAKLKRPLFAAQRALRAAARQLRRGH